MDSGLTDIALRGLEAARLIVDRFVDAVDGAAPARPHPAAPGEPEGADASPPALDAMGRAWAELLRTTADAWTGAPSGDAKATGDVQVGDPGGPVLVASTIAGASAAVDLWIHNQTLDAVDPVRVVLGPLRSAGDAEIATVALRADPQDLGAVPGRSSRAIAITVSPPAGTPPGRYRGLVLIEGLPEAWALLDVTVGDA
jgi:hypothetical protein